MAAQPHAQSLAAHPVPQFPQFDLQPARAVAVFMAVKNGHHFRFPRWLTAPFTCATRQA